MKKEKYSGYPHLLLTKGVIKEQVYHSIRNAVLDGRMRPGIKIPSSRMLAEMMSISRNSVLAGFDRLTDEGYLVTKKGSGTYIAETIPDDLIDTKAFPIDSSETLLSKLKINPHIHEMLPLWENTREFAKGSAVFNVGVGCVDLFPHELWGRLLGRVWRQSRNKLGQLNEPAGHASLREIICDYVRTTRGLNCTKEQIIIVNGTQQAINLTAQVFLQKGDEVWLDEPGYDGALGVFKSIGAKARPIIGDDQGMDIDYGIKNWPNAKLVFTAPSHQFPLGSTLSLPRRLALLDWASENDAWIFEDDYNSEYRYKARPIQALQGLDKHQRVIYAGTFSKIMFPEFRLAFMVVPNALINVFTLTKYYEDTRSSYLEQATLALFISEGHYARHVRKIRRACDERKKVLEQAIQAYLSDKVQPQPSDSGIHLVCWLLGGLTEKEVIDKCRQIGLGVQPLSRYCQQPFKKQAILLGYAAHSPDEIVDGVKRLASII